MSYENLQDEIVDIINRMKNIYDFGGNSVDRKRAFRIARTLGYRGSMNTGCAPCVISVVKYLRQNVDLDKIIKELR